MKAEVVKKSRRKRGFFNTQISGGLEAPGHLRCGLDLDSGILNSLGELG